MIRSCMLSRKELIDLVLKSPQTEDGIYFCPRFRSLVLMDGPIGDGDYYYDRFIFKDKICFTDDDIKVFLAHQDMNIDIDFIKIVDDKMLNALNGIDTLYLDDKVPNTDYTLSELIDTCMFICEEKYA